VTVRLLDDFAVEVDGARIDIGGPRARALVARLALERGRAVALDALVDDLWGGGAPEIRTALRAYMSRLRGTPLGPWLSGGRVGYRLAPHADLVVDLWMLQDALAAGGQAASAAAGEVLAGWHDAPLRGIGEPPFVVAARARIRRAADAARIRAARTDLEAGRIDSALLALHPLRLAHPDDEDLLALVRMAEARAVTADRAFVRIASTGSYESAPPAGTETRPASARRAASPWMSRRRGIPTPIARMVGRREERAAITAALDVARLVTLTGGAGVGKTRLAVDWLSSEAAAGEEHIWFVSVGGVDGAQVGERIASIVASPDPSPDGIAAHLADRRGILVIDGADATGADVAAIAVAVLSRARGLAVLTTSRRTLEVPGESVLRVDPLPLAEACDLFDARLVSDAPSATDGEAVIDLVERLGRLPLAIELAAARAAVMPVEEVAESMLRDIGRSEPAGDDPLAAALRSSLALLAADQRDTLRSVSGFAGPFTRESVAAVCGERSRDSDLDRLVALSMISAESGGAAPVFRVSALIRRAAHEGEGPSTEWWRRHRDWFVARAERAAVDLTSLGSATAIARIRAEWPDMMTAFDSAARLEDRASCAAIAGGLLWFAVRTGQQRDVLDLARRADALPGTADAARESQLRLSRGFLAYQLGSMHEAAASISSAGEAADLSDDPALRAVARAFAAYLLTLDPRSSRDPVPVLGAALRDLDRLPDAAASMVLLIGGQVHRASGRARDAIRLLERAGALATRCGHEWVALMAPVVAAKVHLDGRQGAPALATLVPVVQRSAQDGDPVSLLIAASVVAGAAAALGEDPTGARIIGAVDAIGRRYGFDPRANEPADFELYLHRVREGLTPAEWQSAYAHGLQCEVDELVDLAGSLVGRR
jgi:predicted ATPase/DNA-binding SARP family transcriptional activator